MMTSPLGLDISKRKFDACLARDGGKFRHRVLPNSPDGFSQLSARLAKQKAERVHACLEATGMHGGPRDLLLSIPGIGETAAARLLANARLHQPRRQRIGHPSLANDIRRESRSGACRW